MKYLKEFENYKHKSIEYDRKWKMPRNKIREEIHNDVSEMALEITDIGYNFHFGGFTFNNRRHEFRNIPYIWVGKRINKRHNKRIKFSYEEISYFIDRLKVYFDGMEFNTKEELVDGHSKENLNQLYLYFWPKKELE